MSSVAAESFAEPVEEDEALFFSSWNFLRAAQLLCLCPLEGKKRFQHQEQSSIGGMPGRVDDEEEEEGAFLLFFFCCGFLGGMGAQPAEESVPTLRICVLTSL